MRDQEQQKTAAALKTLHGFFGQFGNDVHAQVLMEVLLEGIMNAETLFVFGEQEQTRDQAGHNPPVGEVGLREAGESGGTETPPSLATPDLPDYP